MSDIFAEATVKISPSLTGFKTDLEKDLKDIMARVKVPPVRVKPALAVGFIGDLRGQVNDAIARVQGQIKPIRVRVQIEAPSRRALQEVVRGAPVTVPGAIGGVAAATAGATDAQIAREQRLSALRAQGAVDLGDVVVAEQKVEQARRKGNATAKVTETRTQQQARADKLAGDAQKILNNAQFVAATRTGELAQAKSELAETSKAVATAEKAQGISLTKTTSDTLKAARAAQTLALERVQEIEARPPPVAAAAGFTSAQRTARAAGAAALRQAVEGEREAAKAFDATGKNVKDLATQKDILAKRTDALTAANKAVRTSLKAESDTLRVAAAATRDRLKTQVEASKTLVKSLREQEREQNRLARSEKRRAEQLSRGGQASILSLAGIRGATLAASRSFLAGAAAVTVFANAVRQFADLERNLHVFEATTSATEAQMEAVREEARLLGADLTLPSVTAEEAAGAMVELAKAGLTVEDSIDAARAVLELATAAAIENAEATRLVANVLNAFSLAGTEATDVADTLANAANAAQGSIADIGTAFQQAASAGRQVGLSFQDTAVFLTILAKNGIRGSDAGTSLRTALIRLINPSKRAKEQFRELGIEIHDATGALRPDIFLQIAAATREMAPAQRDATIALIGGQDAFRAVTILGRQSIETFLEMRRALREEGTAAELAAARTKGLHGSIDALQSILETVGTTMASHVGPGIAAFVYQIGRGITAMSESNEVATALEQTLEAIAGAFHIVGQAIKAVSVVALPLANVLLQLTNAFGVPTLLGFIAAYKILGGTLERVTKGVVAARTAWAALGAAQATTATAGAAAGFAQMGGVLTEVSTAQTKAIGTTTKLRAAITAAASSFNVYLLAASAAAAGLIFLLNRETEAERATRRLKESTDELVTSLQERNRLATEARDAPLQVNQARLSVLEAEEAAGRARGALDQSDAARGTFARTKLELQLAVALDNVEIAQNAYNDAVSRASQIERQRQQAVLKTQQDRENEIKNINDLIKAEEDRARIVIGKGPDEGRTQEARELLASQLISKALQERIKEQEDLNTVESLGFANRLKLLQKTNDAIVGLPDGVVDIVLNAPNLKEAGKGIQEALREAGEGGSAILIESILLQLGVLPKKLQDFIDGPVRQGIIAASRSTGETGGETLAVNYLAAFQSALKRSLGRQAGAEIQEDLAVIASPAQGATLPALRNQLAEAQRQRALSEAEIARLTGAGRTKGLASAREARRKAIADERRIIEEIRGLNEQIANDAEAAAREAEEKQKTIFEDILKAMGLRRERQQEKIEDAELTEGLEDNIRQTAILRRIAAQQIKALRERIARAKAQGKDVSVLIEGLRNLRDIWRDLGREIASLQKQQQEALRDILFERLDLRIQIAQSREDVAAELRARRAKLREITDELVKARRQHGKNSVEWLRLKAAQEEELAAIRELEGNTKEAGTTAFSLLQQNAETFAAIAGDLTGFDLPFAEVSDFTADLTPLLTRRPGQRPGQRPGGRVPPTSTGISGAASFGGALAQALISGRGGVGDGVTAAVRRQEQLQNRQNETTTKLIAALERNTKALTGDEDPKRKKGTRSGAEPRNQRWLESSANRQKAHGTV